MIEAELRARFDREVGISEDGLRGLVWQFLEEAGYVDDVCSGPSTWEEFREEANRWAEKVRHTVGRTKPPGRTSTSRYTDVSLTNIEEEHAAAFAAYMVKRAAFSPEVQSFRHEKLSSVTLEPEQVAAFLWRELRFLPPERYADLGGYADIKWLLGVSPPSPVGEEDELKDLLGGWQNRSEESQSRYSYEAFRKAIELDSMAIPVQPQEPMYLRGLMHLVRDKTGRTLEDIGSQLVARYPWTLRDAAWFVLTGEAPAVRALKLQTDEPSGAHTLTFAPWISEKTIRRAYRTLRERDNRPLSSKTLAAFRFVDEHTDPERTPRWAKLTEEWNQQYPDDKFRDRSALRQAYERAEERLASPWLNDWSLGGHLTN